MKRKNMMGRNLLRSIKRSAGRYIAIMAIIALGAGLFCGLRVTKVDMVATLQQYTDRQNMFDLQVMNTYGWTQADVDALAQAPGIAGAEGSISLDALLRFGDGEDQAYKLIALPEEINRIHLDVGRLPQAPNECLADSFAYDETILGTQVQVSQRNEESTLDGLAYDSYTIVGLVNTPLYLNMQRGSTSIGKGTLATFFYLPMDGFSLEVFTQINLTLEGDYRVYTDEYDDAMDAMADGLEPLTLELAQGRYDSVRAEAEEAYNEGYQEYLDGLADYTEGKQELQDAYEELTAAEEELEENRQELADGQTELDSARSTLSETSQTLTSSQTELDSQKKTAYADLDAAKAELDANQKTVDENMPAVIEALTQIDSGLAPLNQGIGELNAGIDQIDGALAELDLGIAEVQENLTAAQDRGDAETAAQLEAQLAQLNAQKESLQTERAPLQEKLDELLPQQQALTAQRAEVQAQKDALDAAQTQINAGYAQWKTGKETADAEFAAAQAQIDAGWSQVNAGWQELSENQATIDEGLEQLAEAETEIEDGWEDYEEGMAELLEAESELADAREELDDAWQEIEDIAQPSVYRLTRNTNLGYVVFESDSDIVAGVATIFPAFFLAVAALVCITTMTRMVDEERTQIGVLKALGYGSGAIVGKYLGYSGSASLVGCAAGVLLGSTVFPQIIWNAYCIMYNFSGQVVLTYDGASIAFVIFSYTGLTLLVTWYCCRRELRDVPAELIRPRAPEAGKQLWLEKRKFWERLSFLNKVAIRNIFRYRQRLLMMLLGIGGCTALLVGGFGLRDSIAGVAQFQFENVMQYDIGVTFDDPQSVEQQAAFRQALGDRTEGILFCHQSSVDLDFDDSVKNVNFIVTDSSLEGFIDLHRGETPIPMPGENETVISVGAAASMGISVGDSVILRSPDMEEMAVTVSGIFDNNVYNYAIISARTLENQWDREPQIQMALVQNRDGQDVHQTAAAITDAEGVLNVTINQDTAENVGNMMNALDAVIILVVVCAGLLAGTVLYNLTNINIKERIREIATIKVLGFHAGETASYVFKENLALTVMGILLGLGAGKWLHAAVMSYIRIDMVWFDNRIAGISYVLSGVLTLLAALLVDFIMYFQLEKINMAEALKSVE